MDNQGIETILGQALDETCHELDRTRLELQRVIQLNNTLLRELESSRLAMIQVLVQAIEARDTPTNGHCQRVVHYSLATAEKLGMERSKMDGLHYGVLLHDIGKIGVPDAILNKPGPLTEEEWIQMKRHPQLGYELLHELNFLDSALPVVLYHHERFDGSGYPHGLNKYEIPEAARIFALADSFDAMTTDRPYRKARSPEAAIEEILRCRGVKYDPEVTDAFLMAYEGGFPVGQKEVKVGSGWLGLPSLC
jgi:HD-GYP domain-containing protein (c-di-GMP phosphodiesterase class II)